MLRILNAPVAKLERNSNSEAQGFPPRSPHSPRRRISWGNGDSSWWKVPRRARGKQEGRINKSEFLSQGLRRTRHQENRVSALPKTFKWEKPTETLISPLHPTMTWKHTSAERTVCVAWNFSDSLVYCFAFPCLLKSVGLLAAFCPSCSPLPRLTTEYGVATSP